MTMVFVLTLMPLLGLPFALVWRRSLAARFACVGVALLGGGLSMFMLIAAHRLAELEPGARPESADWQRGVTNMRRIVLLPVPLMVGVFTALTVMAFLPHETASRQRD